MLLTAAVSVALLCSGATLESPYNSWNFTAKKKLILGTMHLASWDEAECVVFFPIIFNCISHSEECEMMEVQWNIQWVKWKYCMVSDPVKEHGFLKELRLSDLVLLIISLLLWGHHLFQILYQSSRHTFIQFLAFRLGKMIGALFVQAQLDQLRISDAGKWDYVCILLGFI